LVETTSPQDNQTRAVHPHDWKKSAWPYPRPAAFFQTRHALRMTAANLSNRHRLTFPRACFCYEKDFETRPFTSKKPMRNIQRKLALKRNTLNNLILHC